MAKKIRDIAVKTGEYTDNQGNTKGRWLNVGSLMKGDDGGEFIVMNRWFNPSGVPNPDHRDSVLLSCFPLRDQQGGGQAPAPAQPAPAPQPQPAADGFDSDIPF